ncbi:MAG: sulfatase-like hydrolase/transferase [Planctomycetales bacterium]|nr:sulfatase-like hydrolase/transferase [Planctomycetales bacterium]
MCLVLNRMASVLALGCLVLTALPLEADDSRPNIILVMADDQGWGETGYYGHPVLKTPNLDAMSRAGIRFDRYYAGAPVCSPTRAAVLTGRTNNRTGVQSHGYALRLQEKTLSAALQAAGYATGHFGKWHLNGLRGPGVPVLADDDHNPGIFGFDQWLSVTNFFDRNPVLSRQGAFEEFQGDSSEIVVAEALKFIEHNSSSGKPSFTVIWYGTPHSPFVAAEEDMRDFAGLDPASRNHYGELVAMDRSIGQLRKRLKDLGIAENTLVWFTSDNGGLPNITPSTVGGLRGFKGSVYEGGLRVPAILEWPGRIHTSMICNVPACAMDIFPTLSAIVGLPDECHLHPLDGIDLTGVIDGTLTRRPQPIVFNYSGSTALTDNEFKLIEAGRTEKHYELYDLSKDAQEENNLYLSQPDLADKMLGMMRDFQLSLQASIDGRDYVEQQVNVGEPEPRSWREVEGYRPFFEQWRARPEYKSYLKD